MIWESGGSPQNARDVWEKALYWHDATPGAWVGMARAAGLSSGAEAIVERVESCLDKAATLLLSQGQEQAACGTWGQLELYLSGASVGFPHPSDVQEKGRTGDAAPTRLKAKVRQDPTGCSQTPPLSGKGLGGRSHRPRLLDPVGGTCGCSVSKRRFGRPGARPSRLPRGRGWTCLTFSVGAAAEAGKDELKARLMLERLWVAHPGRLELADALSELLVLENRDERALRVLCDVVKAFPRRRVMDPTPLQLRLLKRLEAVSQGVGDPDALRRARLLLSRCDKPMGARAVWPWRPRKTLPGPL